MALDIIVQGIKIISVESKSELRKIGAFFQIFNIPTYYLFDSDISGSQNIPQKNENRNLTRFINGIEQEDPDGAYDGYFAFKPNFESIFKDYEHIIVADSPPPGVLARLKELVAQEDDGKLNLKV